MTGFLKIGYGGMNAVTAGFCRYGTYSMRHRLHRSVLYGGIDTVDSGVLIFVHRNDQTFLPVDDLGVNLSDFSGLTRRMTS